MDKDAMITYLIGELKKENLELHDLIIPEELEEKQKLLRALFNTRKPMAGSRDTSLDNTRPLPTS